MQDLENNVTISIFFDEDIERIVIRGTEGEFAVLAEHTPLTTSVAIGTFNIIFGDKKTRSPNDERVSKSLNVDW